MEMGGSNTPHCLMAVVAGICKNGHFYHGSHCDQCVHIDNMSDFPCPFLMGMSDGPHSSANEINFNTPNRFKEMRHCIKKAAEHGDFKTKKDWANAKFLWNNAEKYRDIKKVDYQKTGHGIYGGWDTDKNSEG